MTKPLVVLSQPAGLPVQASKPRRMRAQRLHCRLWLNNHCFGRLQGHALNHCIVFAVRNRLTVQVTNAHASVVAPAVAGLLCIYGGKGRQIGRNNYLLNCGTLST